MMEGRDAMTSEETLHAYHDGELSALARWRSICDLRDRGLGESAALP